MDNNQLLSRDDFRSGVFRRDVGRCVVCLAPAQDAHHLLERRLFRDGGYYLNNGVSVCGECHLQAEQTLISVERLRVLAGITEIVIPPHLHPEPMDKWGNPILPNGLRMRGELFDDPSVQRVLSSVLHLFTKYAKHPRTWHLPWSEGATADDRTLRTEDLGRLKAGRIAITTKMDGECLAASTRIAMADGTQTRIRDIVTRELVGSLVLGVRGKKVVPTRILRVFDNGSTKSWLQVRVRWSNGPPRLIYCTENHRFYVPSRGCYVSARRLQRGEPILLIKRTLGLTAIQKDVLLGTLLGDGSLHVRPGATALVQVGHKQAHARYLQWTADHLGQISRGLSTYTSGYGTKMLKLSSACTRAIYTKFASMIVDGKKTVPSWVEHELTSRALAFWYMDDGTLQHSDQQRDRMQFSVCDFTTHDCEVLRAALLRLGVQSSLHFYRGYPYLDIGANDTELLAALIAPFVPPIMQYKLPAEYRGRVVSVPEDADTPYEQYAQESVVLGVERKAHWVNRIRYDIETETHNYFANGVLVHNCTSLYADHVHARSVDDKRDPARDWVKNLWGTIRHDIPDGWRVCGENLFETHAIRYDALPSYFLVHSIWDDKNMCLPFEDTRCYAMMLGLHMVPVLYVGEWALDTVVGDSEQEGYVVRTTDAFHYRDYRYCVAKYVRAGFTPGRRRDRGQIERNGLAT